MHGTQTPYTQTPAGLNVRAMKDTLLGNLIQSWTPPVHRWAVGVLLYEMLAGFPPWQDGNTYAVYRAVMAAHLEFPTGFDPVAKVPLPLPAAPHPSSGALM